MKKKKTLKPIQKSTNPVRGPVDVGHVHMKAANLAVIESFYVDILGFNISAKMPQALFLTSDSYHHTLAFNTWRSLDGPQPTEKHTGLFHIALRYATRRDLADALKRLIDAQYEIDGLSDHGTHEALYLRDPENNGIELYWDRPMDEWPLDENGHLLFANAWFDIKNLLAELE